MGFETPCNQENSLEKLKFKMSKILDEKEKEITNQFDEVSEG